MPDLSGLAVTRYETAVTDAEVQQTLDVLRKQRATFEAREGRASQDGDRVTLDFAGTIDGVPFEGGKAEGFPFVLGQGRMLPEFEEAARGLKAGETKVFRSSSPMTTRARKSPARPPSSPSPSRKWLKACCPS